MKSPNILFLSTIMMVSSFSTINTDNRILEEAHDETFVSTLVNACIQAIDDRVIGEFAHKEIQSAIDNCDKNDDVFSASMNNVSPAMQSITAQELKKLITPLIDTAEQKAHKFSCVNCEELVQYLKEAQSHCSKAIEAQKGTMTLHQFQQQSIGQQKRDIIQKKALEYHLSQMQKQD